MLHMDQITLGLDPLPKKTRKEIFLEEMNQVVAILPHKCSLPSTPAWPSKA